ncbi:MAG: arginase family protein [Chloroflexota bacterium]
MYLFFPQWQGSGATDEVYHGARLVRESLPTTINFVEVPVKLLHPVTLENNIWGYSVLVEQLESACATLKQHNPAQIFSVGGDCTCEIAPVSFLNQHYQGDLAVVWFDAHADMNTPESSPSKTLHGMPLRTLLGEGDPHMVQSMFSTLSPRQVFLVGAREFDPDEERYIQAHQVSLFSPDTIARNPQNLIDTIANAGFNNLYIHFDFDVIDPAEFPYTAFPTANGLSIAQLMTVLDMLRAHFNIAGFSLLELVPGDNPSLAAIEPILSLFSSFADEGIKNG